MENPKRLAILRILVDAEIPVGELAHRVGLSQSALSQHLAKLRNANVVQTRREAQVIYYFSHSDAVRRILATLEAIFREQPPVSSGCCAKRAINSPRRMRLVTLWMASLDWTGWPVKIPRRFRLFS